MNASLLCNSETIPIEIVHDILDENGCFISSNGCKSSNVEYNVSSMTYSCLPPFSCANQYNQYVQLTLRVVARKIVERGKMFFRHTKAWHPLNLTLCHLVSITYKYLSQSIVSAMSLPSKDSPSWSTQFVTRRWIVSGIYWIWDSVTSAHSRNRLELAAEGHIWIHQICESTWNIQTFFIELFLVLPIPIIIITAIPK
jgi:hypothetical protein